jgi:hypothetical protein
MIYQIIISGVSALVGAAIFEALRDAIRVGKMTTQA